MFKFNINFLNNIKVKHKLILIYIFCVVAPIIIINLIFYQNMEKNVKEIDKNYYRLSTQRIASQIENDLNFIIKLCNRISMDQQLYEMLDKNYKDNLEFAEEYYKYFEQYMYFNGESYEQVSKMMAYTDNPSILNSGLVFRIDSQVRNEEWYKKVVNTPNKIHVIYGRTEKRADNTILTPVSIIKVLDEFQGIDKYEKIIRIDVYAENIVNIINSENVRGSVFIVDSMGDLLFADSNTNDIENINYFIRNNMDRIIQRKINDHFNWAVTNIIDIDDLNTALQKSRNNIIFLTLMSLLLSSIIILLIYRSFYIRLNILSEHVSNLDQEDFGKQYTGLQGKDEIGNLIKAYNRMVRKIKTLIMDVYEAKLDQSNIKLEKKQAEINALQSQMNPHFLFNTLESIRMKSLEKGEKDTAEIIKYLARSFRRMISFRQEWVNVSEEVGYIKDFLKIQKYRFGSEFEYILDIDPDTLRVKIPKLILQPFVENACIHGIEGSEETGEVYVQVKIVDSKLKCIIKDNGIGEEKLNSILWDIKNEKIQNNNIGIENIYKRLNLYYGDEFDLIIDSIEGKGTNVQLMIPMGVEV